MKKPKILLLAAVAALAMAACNNNRNDNNADTTMTPTDSNAITPGAVTPDTAPAAQLPPGAPNPGEDSARYGTGTNDSSKNRQPQ
jgi:hypothetical protein